MTTQAAPPAGRVIGQPVRRKEDARVITGQARWTDNLTLPGLAHLAIVRSPMAHARIGKADVSAALEQPGVIAAFTGRDLAPDYGSLPTAWIVSDDLIVPDHPPIAADEAPAPAATQAPAAEGTAGPQAAAAGESLDLVSTVAMPVLKRFGPVLGGVACGLIFGLLLGHRRRIVIMTAAAPPGGYPPARTVL
jgi:aerobic carbon-monoxide dehydrogenase large subunit